MQLDYKDGLWMFDGGYHDRMTAKDAGFCWAGKPHERYWWTDEPLKAAKLKDIATPEALAAIEKHGAGQLAALEASRATSADIHVPKPEGLNYYPFQLAGIKYAAERDNTLLGDEMGTGKTLQVLGLINLDPNIKRVLVICPATIKINWKREGEKWLVRPRNIAVVNAKDPFPEDADMVIINYDIVGRYRDELRAKEWDLLVVDECHYLKNGKTGRTKEILGKYYRKKADRITPIPAKKKMFLTGTPILNRPAELWTVLKALDPKTWGSWFYFHKRFCDAKQTRFGWDMSGSSHLDELQDKLRSTIMVRRMKAEVLKELPPKVRQVIELPAMGSRKKVAAERRAWELQEEDLAELYERVELSMVTDDTDEHRAAVDALKVGRMAAFGAISRMRKETAIAKIPMVLAHLEQVLENGKKVVLFAHHHAVVDRIAEELGRACVTLTGDTPQEARQMAIDRFQADESCRVFIGSIKAAGVGITLTAASHVIFAELDWTPASLSQAEDRCHRIGQVDSVLVQHLVFEESLDAIMARKVIAKQIVIDQALDDSSTSVSN